MYPLLLLSGDMPTASYKSKVIAGPSGTNFLLFDRADIDIG